MGKDAANIAADMRMFSTFATRLPQFLRAPITLDYARATVQQRLRSRESSFLSSMRRGVFSRPESPYFKLLTMAGCEYGDLEGVVNHEGLEAALVGLAGSGVWLSFNEFKGNTPIVRGSWRLETNAGNFDNPFLNGQLEARSGGGSHPGTRTAYDLQHIAMGRSLYKALTFDAYGAGQYPVIMWSPIAPGYGPLEVLAHVKAGKPPLRWFTPVSAKQGRATLRDRFINASIPLACRLIRISLPPVTHVAPDGVRQVSLAVEAARDTHRGCIVLTDPSSAVRVCADATSRGADMEGVLFVVGGEPITTYKRAIIRQAGAVCSPLFVFIEGGYVGIACLEDDSGDEVHLLSDSIALVQHERYVEHARETVDAFLFTTLLPTAPKLLLNVESGDFGVVRKTDCDCYFGRMGFNTGISQIRSFDKLTSAGMNVTASYFLRLVESVLPSTFGGTLLDYQFVEEETGDGIPHITVLVAPEVGDIDERLLIEAVLCELRADGKRGGFPGEVWSQSDTLRVRRERPSITSRGKLLPLQVRR